MNIPSIKKTDEDLVAAVLTFVLFPIILCIDLLLLAKYILEGR